MERHIATGGPGNASAKIYNVKFRAKSIAAKKLGGD